MARQLTAKDPVRAAQMLAEVETEIARALEDLRDLARGIYPPLLADQGLPAALTAQAPTKVEVVNPDPVPVVLKDPPDPEPPP